MKISYEWHNLLRDPNDLPEGLFGATPEILTILKNTDRDEWWYQLDQWIDGDWLRADRYITGNWMMAAWKYEPPFEEVDG